MGEGGVDQNITFDYKGSGGVIQTLAYYETIRYLANNYT